MQAAIRAIEYHLPEKILSTEDLSREFPEWPVEKIAEKTGIYSRHLAGPDECASDLAVAAAQKLFASGVVRAEDIDFILLCTQSPDYFLPTTACLVQDRLGIRTSAGALDFNLGCSGFIYGLGLAKGLIETGQARKVLLLTAETYSKFLYPKDRSVRTIFGDAAAATLIVAEQDGPAVSTSLIGPFVYGTDGSGGKNLTVPTGGMRNPRPSGEAEAAGKSRADSLFMDGSEIFAFTIEQVPESVRSLMRTAGIGLDDIDLFVFHQANRYMMEHLRKSLKIAPEKFAVALSHCGNTVSSTIPIALKDALAEGTLRPGMLTMLVGFGVGYSWGATLVRWV